MQKGKKGTAYKCCIVYCTTSRWEPRELEGKAPSGEGLQLDEDEQRRVREQASNVWSIDDDEEDPVVQQQKVCPCELYLSVSGFHGAIGGRVHASAFTIHAIDFVKSTAPLRLSCRPLTSTGGRCARPLLGPNLLARKPVLPHPLLSPVVAVAGVVARAPPSPRHPICPRWELQQICPVSLLHSAFVQILLWCAGSRGLQNKCVPPWRPSHCPLQTNSLPSVAGNAFIAHLARNTNPHANCHPRNRALQVAGGAAAGVAGAAAAAFAANLVLKRAQKLVRLCGRQRRRSSRCREAVGRGRFDVF